MLTIPYVAKEVSVSKDVPGFVSNALLMPFINEVVRFLGILAKTTDTHIPRPFCV